MARNAQFTARMDADLIRRLERRGRELGESKSRLAERLLDDGLRCAEFPGIVFRSDQAGRHATLQNGLDVWEIVAELHRARRLRHVDPIKAATRRADVTVEQVRLAAAYYERYPDEIDGEIERRDELHRASEAGLARFRS